MGKIIINNIVVDGNGYVSAHGEIVTEFSIGENGYGTVPKIDSETLRALCVGALSGDMQVKASNVKVEYKAVTIPDTSLPIVFEIGIDGKLNSFIKED